MTTPPAEAVNLELLETLGLHLRSVREAKGVTRVKLAVELGVHSSSVTQWENGKTWPHTKHTLAMRRLLDEPTLFTEQAAA